MALKRDKFDDVFSQLVRERTDCNYDEYFYYQDGNLIWKTRNFNEKYSSRSVKIFNSMYAGKIAGSFDSNGYRQVKLGGSSKKVHRVIWEMHYGAVPSGMQIDHINQIKDDNRIENLRVVSNKENHKNMPISKRNKSGFNGVSWCEREKAWRAFVGMDGALRSLGYFKSKREAINKRKEFNLNNGFHANHGGNDVNKER
ncbi:HNH endonuclease [Salmonella enterica subsp. houtenae]|nr:HNH endonuclease [Salmonella enterica subsp. houtenae]EDN5095804.1 HNH endonuclease [Salmonella enterica subsp. houtenae]